MTRNSSLLGYGVVLLNVALALAFSLLLKSLIQPTPLALFYVSVLISAWYGGVKSGLVATVLSILAISYLIPPYNSLNILNMGNLLRLGVFVLIALLISRLNQSQQAALQREQRLRTEVETSHRRLTQLLEHMTDAFVILDRDWRIIYANAAAERLNQKPRSAMLGKTYWEEWPLSIGTNIDHQYRRAMTEQVPVYFEHHYYAPPASDIWLEIHAYPSDDGLNIFYREISEAKRDEVVRKQSELVLVEQKRLLEMIALGYPLDECLAALCESVSRLNPGIRACILLTDAQGLTFPRSITPHFPPSFGQGLQDAPINELCIGTCGEAVYSGQPVTCADIANDQRWSREWRDLCIAHGILACHSVPILGIENQPLGSLMLCFDEARLLSDWEHQLSTFGTQIASIVLERDRTNAALLESEEQLRLATESANLGLWHWHVQKDTLTWTDRCKALFGLPADTAMSYQVFLNAVHPEDRQRIQEMRPALEEGQLGRHEIEYRTVWPDGTVRWLMARGSAIYDTDSNPVSSMGVIFDITDRKQAEEALRRSEAAFRTIANAAPALVWVGLPNGEVTFFNDRWYEYTGQSETEAIGFGWVETIHPDDVTQLLPHWEHCRQTGKIYEGEVRYRRHDGVYRWHAFRALPRHAANGEIEAWYGLSVDISDRVQTERDRECILQQEQAAREAAEAANRIKDEFLAVVSHELRSPLNPILGWAKLLRTRQLDEQKTTHALEVIERNAQMQAQLINDLLDVSRILRGKLSLDPKPIDLAFIIQAAMETVRLAAAAKSIQMYTQFEPDVGQVSGDAGRLQQVVWNLLTNAVKFTSAGGRVEIHLERVETQAQITIRDTGKGIPADFLPYVFDQFRQESSATTRRFGGLGLGLAIVRYLVELHGGTVRADSPGEGQGATFTVRLPLMPHQPLTNQPPSLPEPALNLQGSRILVVDDDDHTREFLAFLLELQGANVIAVATANEAIATLTQFQPDVLVSDIGMPDVDGYMLMQQVRALSTEQRRIPAIALTAYAGEIDYQQAIAAGFQRHLSKPIEPEVLIRAIAELRTKD